MTSATKLSMSERVIQLACAALMTGLCLLTLTIFQPAARVVQDAWHFAEAWWWYVPVVRAVDGQSLTYSPTDERMYASFAMVLTAGVICWCVCDWLVRQLWNLTTSAPDD